MWKLIRIITHLISSITLPFVKDFYIKGNEALQIIRHLCLYIMRSFPWLVRKRLYIVETIPYLAKKVKLGKKGGGFYLKIEGWWG